METPSDANSTLQTQRVIPYPAGAIYAAFADPARLAKWWGPNGFSNTFESFEFEVGGRWEFLMHGPDGHAYPNTCVFRELAPDTKLVVAHVSPPRFTLSVELLPVADGTQIRWVQAFEDPQVAEAVRHIAEPGNEQNLDKLHAHLRGELG